jgi:hypothetical protein
VVARVLEIASLKRRLAELPARLGDTTPERLITVLIISCVLLGLFFRARGFLFGSSAFWLDESMWAVNIMTRPLTENWVRPIGFITISKLLAVVFSPSEMVLRALPWLAGVAATVGAPFLARLLYTAPGARLLFVAILTLNPCAIDFSKEFKPYSLGLTLHLALFGLVLRYVQARTPRALGAALATAVLGIFFTQDLVFAYPGVFLVLGWETFKHNRRHLIPVVGCALLIVVALVAQYFLIWRRISAGETDTWASKYNVFWVAGGEESYFRWAIMRYLDMLALPGYRHTTWTIDWMTFEERERFRDADQVLWLLVHALGLAVLVAYRRLRAALLIVLPLLMVFLFNRLGFWPLGAFRTNVFTLAYSTAVAGMAADLPISRARLTSALPALLLVLLPLGLFERTWHEKKLAFTYESRFPDVLKELIARHAADEDKDVLIFDRRSCHSYRYYSQFDAVGSRLYGPPLAERYEVSCVGNDDRQIATLVRENLSIARSVWLVIHSGKPVDPNIRKGRIRDTRLVSRFDIGAHRVMAFRARR